MKLTTITCTGDRPEAFTLAERWMAAQTVQPSRWLVIDDGKTPTVTTQGQEVIRLPPLLGNTVVRNMLAALDHCSKDDEGIVVWEDDDYYSHHYLATIQPLLEKNRAVGECENVYYHVPNRMVQFHKNTMHASWCATSFRFECAYMVREAALARKDPYIDMGFWCHPHLVGVNRGAHLYKDVHHVIGIKGLPGRPGTCGGHTVPKGEWDQEFYIARQLMGTDADVYQKYYSPPPPRYFQIFGAEHRQGNRTYFRGEVVESICDLVNQFKGKFIEVPKPKEM